MSDSMRVTEHPILGTDAGSKTVTIYYEDRPITARAGEPIAAAPGERRHPGAPHNGKNP